MSNTILIKRSGTPGSIPNAANVSFGELAINYSDGTLFYKDAGGTVKVIASSQFVLVTGNVTGGNINTSGLVNATGNITGGNIVTAGLVTATGNITGGNVISLGKVEAVGTVTAGNVAYTNVDGTNGQTLKTYGNGVTFWDSLSTGALPVYIRAGGFLQIQTINGILNVVGRSGNISVIIT
jgi:hypothetical protein